MSGSFDVRQRRLLEAALRKGEPLHCPACGQRLSEQTVPTPVDVAYVRHRVWVLCPSCRRTASLDVKR